MSRPRLAPGVRVAVTGASSGLGRALAGELARRGHPLVLVARRPGALAEAAAEARALGSPDVVAFTADLADPAQTEALGRSLAALDPPVEALVNNAGAGRAGPWRTTEADRSLVALLIDAPLALTRALLPAWHRRGRGAVLNVASSGAFQPGPQTSVYYAAKAFLASWSLALAREERSWLAVTTLCPGALKTGFARAAGRLDVATAPGPEAVARQAVVAWGRGRGLVVPGWGNALLVGMSRVLPPELTAAMVEGIQLRLRTKPVRNSSGLD